MATLNLGRIKPVFRCAYAGGTAYVVDDIVTSGGETFICILASTGNATSNATYWTKLAEKGLDGTDVGTTLTTQGDILYRDGSGLQRLGAGTSGQFLKTQGSGANPVWGDLVSPIVKVTQLENTTRYSLSDASDTALFTMTVNKSKDASTSYLLVHGQIPSRGAYSDYCGQYFDCLTTGVTTHNTDNGSAFQGIAVGEANGTSRQQITSINQKWQDTTNLGSGDHTFEYGWRVKTGATGNRPAHQINPNSSDDNRMHQQSSTFTFYEILI